MNAETQNTQTVHGMKLHQYLDRGSISSDFGNGGVAIDMAVDVCKGEDDGT